MNRTGSLPHAPLTAIGALAVALAAFSPLHAPSAQAQAQPAQAQPAGQDITIRLAGSNIIGLTIIPPLVTAWAKSQRMPSIRTEAGQNNEEYTMLAEGAESQRRLRIEVKLHGTPTGTEPLLRGQTDFWMASRPAREADLEAMRRRAVPNVPTLAQMQAPGVENVVALDGIAIIVHPSNPIRRLSFLQLRDVFLGKITNWSALGGANLPIQVYAPDPGFGTFEALCNGVLAVPGAVLPGAVPGAAACAQQMVRLAAPHFKSLDDLADAVAANPGAISWDGMAARGNARAIQIATGCGSLHVPEAFGVKADEYPLARRSYVYVYPGRPLSPAAQDFLKFMLSPAGQAALQGAGAVDLLPGISSNDYVSDRLDTAGNALDNGETRIRAPDVQAFEDATQEARRLSVTFRFREGTNSLDSRAEADLGRLVGLMQTPAYAKSRLVLIGFSAARGDYLSNRTLSRERAASVRDRLIAMGVKDVAAIGVGPVAPVACNGPAGEASGAALLNQRVETWVRPAPGG